MTRNELFQLSKEEQIKWFQMNNQRELFELAERLKDPNYQTLLQSLLEADDEEYEKIVESELNYYEIK